MFKRINICSKNDCLRIDYNADEVENLKNVIRIRFLHIIYNYECICTLMPNTNFCYLFV